MDARSDASAPELDRTVNGDSGALDADTAAVRQILLAANRAPRDPDVELATILFELAGRESTEDLEEALRRLARQCSFGSGLTLQVLSE